MHDTSSAEIAIVVAPEWRKHGIGGILVRALEQPAKDAGIERFVAAYLPDNRAIADLLTELGYGDRWLEDDLVWVGRPLR
jgi:GNAT superfamily N-acetyltransferase